MTRHVFTALGAVFLASLLTHCGGDEFSNVQEDGGTQLPDGAAGGSGDGGDGGGSAGASGGAGNAGQAGSAGESGAAGAGGILGPCTDWCGPVGTCDKEICLLATDLAWGDRIVADDDFLYVNTHDAIRKIPKDGSTEPEVFEPKYEGYGGLALTPDRIYFAQENGSRIGHIGKNGMNLKYLATVLGTPNSLAMDESHVYWVELEPTDSDPGRLARVPLPSGPIEVVIDQRNLPHEVVLDDTRIYWIEEAGVFSCPKSQLPCEPTALATVENPHWSPSLQLHESTLWFTGWRKIFRIPISGGTGTEVTSVAGDVRGLFVNETGLFWTVFWTENKLVGEGKVRFLPSKSNTGVIDIATDLHSPVAVFVESGFVYWLNEGANVDGTFQPGSLCKAKLP